MYDTLVKKIGSKVYAGLSLSGQYTFLENKNEFFKKQSLTQQCKIIKQILALMNCKSGPVDLSLIEGSKNSGINLTSKAIQDRDVHIINISPTGYYKTIIDIKSFL